MKPDFILFHLHVFLSHNVPPMDYSVFLVFKQYLYKHYSKTSVGLCKIIVEKRNDMKYDFLRKGILSWYSIPINVVQQYAIILNILENNIFIFIYACLFHKCLQKYVMISYICMKNFILLKFKKFSIIPCL